MNKVWVKLMGFANTGGKHRVLNLVFKVRQFISLVDMLYKLYVLYMLHMVIRLYTMYGAI